MCIYLCIALLWPLIFHPLPSVCSLVCSRCFLLLATFGLCIAGGFSFSCFDRAPTGCVNSFTVAILGDIGRKRWILAILTLGIETTTRLPSSFMVSGCRSLSAPSIVFAHLPGSVFEDVHEATTIPENDVEMNGCKRMILEYEARPRIDEWRPKILGGISRKDSTFQ